MRGFAKSPRSLELQELSLGHTVLSSRMKRELDDLCFLGDFWSNRSCEAAMSRSADGRAAPGAGIGMGLPSFLWLPEL